MDVLRCNLNTWQTNTDPPATILWCLHYWNKSWTTVS